MSKEGLFERAAGDLASELAAMHVTLYNFILALRHTRHSQVQDRLINQADEELKASQSRFMEKYADRIGGATPENN